MSTSSRRKRLESRGGSTTLCSGPVMAHIGFEGARHMHPERCPSAKRERTVSVRLFDVDNDTIDSVEAQSSTVKRLMLNGLSMTSLHQNLIDRMMLLEKLDLGDNQLNDASLPESFKLLENLVELNLNSNKFTKIPSSVRKLKNLTRLSLSFNGIDSLKGMDKLKKIQVLMLDHNKFGNIFKDISHLRKLEILDCSHNNIREVGIDVRNLKNLRELNISNNKISVLPTDVFQLIRLESLKASHNQISKIPVFNLNPQHCHCLAEIDLSGNAISKFPGHLLVMTKKLDLSTNRLKALDWNKMKKIEMKNSPALYVDGNPLTFPPPEVCDCGLRSIMQFFQETQSNVKVYQGIKVLVLGAHDSGKTSFVNTLVDGQARLSQEMYEKSAGIEASDMTFDNYEQYLNPPQENGVAPDENETHQANNLTPINNVLSPHAKGHKDKSGGSRRASAASRNSIDITAAIPTDNGLFDTDGKTPVKSLNLCIWDFCGHDFYLFPHYLFFEQPAIAILTFNMHKYKSDRFDKMISNWFDWMIAKTNKLVVLLVGTHADMLKKGRITSVCNEVKAKLQTHAERQRQLVQKRIDIITEKPHISQTLSAQLNAYSSLLQEKFVVQSEVIVTSAANYTGYDTVRASLELLCNDAKQFPNVLRKIPTFWLDVETYTEERGNTMVVPVVKYEEYKEEVATKFGMKHLLNKILQYLHETGKVLWFSNHSVLKNYVILRPTWFFDVFRAIFRHDLHEKLDIEVEDSFRTIETLIDVAEVNGITQGKYDQMRDEFLTEGIVDRDLLKCMLCHLLPLETNGPFHQTLDLLLDCLDIGYLVSKRPGRDAGYNLDPDTENMHSRKYLLPWFRRVPEPEKVQELWAPLATKRKLSGVCRFAKYLPPGLFEMLSVRAHREKHNLRFINHWATGFHARHKEEPLQVMFTCYPNDLQHQQESVGEDGRGGGDGGEGGATIRFEMRDDCDPNVDEVAASTMWSVLLPILMDLEELLHQYTGVLVERLMECPGCRQLSFLGEWLTPKETQSLQVRSCEECMEEIDTAFLVQPKEKKRDDVRLNLARMRSHRRDALRSSVEAKSLGATDVQAPVRQGRRAAVMPTDMLLMERPSISAGSDIGRPSVSAGSDGEIPGLPGLAGLSLSDLPPFLTGLAASGAGSVDYDDEEDELENDATGRKSSIPFAEATEDDTEGRRSAKSNND